uniref:Uncharacterized protein n=1 Tax=Amphimedon queenslandica TaxID=400682 RepID=A0A1X7UHF5_AMPQE
MSYSRRSIISCLLVESLLILILKLELASSLSCPSFNAEGDVNICTRPNSTDCQIKIRFNVTIDRWILVSGDCAVNCQNYTYTTFGTTFKVGCCPKVEGKVHCPLDGRVFGDGIKPLLPHRPDPTPSVAPSPSSTAMDASRTGSIHPNPTITHVDGDDPTTDPNNPDIITNYVYPAGICLEIAIFAVTLIVLIREGYKFCQNRIRERAAADRNLQH